MVKYLKVSTSCPKFSLTIRRKIKRYIVDPVPVSDPHNFRKLDPPDPDQSKKPDPDPHKVKRGIRIRGGSVCQWWQISFTLIRSRIRTK
jgi:hypothetical protein